MTIRSFVLRQGRMTAGQERAFDEYWPRYGIEIAPTESIGRDYPYIDGRELILEIGFGNGESLVQMAQAFPEKGFIGIEVHRPGVGHALLQAAAADIDNL
ncbi:MAG: hypothetical protein Q4A74_04565 [Cardiobacteriaceae bacterium]|nr:hypothetical protein [Cardiobacteriaceae bacterium]